MNPRARSVRAALIAVSMFAATVGATAGYEQMNYREFRIQLKDAHAAYEAGKFERAAELYQRNACGGDKGSQFALGTMYLLGQGVQPNALKAYAWYAVAAEAPEPKFKKSLAKLEEAIPASHKQVAEKMAGEYMAAYGAKATQMSCRQEAPLGSNIPSLQCSPPVDNVTGIVEFKTCESGVN